MSAAKCWSDPYAHWLPLDQMSSGDQGLIPVKLFAGEFVPVVLELDNIEQAQKWWMKIRGTTTRMPLGYVQRNAGSRYLSIQLLREHARGRALCRKPGAVVVGSVAAGACRLRGHRFVRVGQVVEGAGQRTAPCRAQATRIAPA